MIASFPSSYDICATIRLHRPGDIVKYWAANPGEKLTSEHRAFLNNENCGEAVVQHDGHLCLRLLTPRPYRAKLSGRNVPRGVVYVVRRKEEHEMDGVVRYIEYIFLQTIVS